MEKDTVKCNKKCNNFLPVQIKPILKNFLTAIKEKSDKGNYQVRKNLQNLNGLFKIKLCFYHLRFDNLFIQT